MKNVLVRSLGGALCWLIAGCSGPGSVAEESGEAVGAREDAIYVYSDKTLFTSNFTVNTCFEGGSSAARLEVRAAVEATWEEVTWLDFTGWATCPSTIPSTMVPINLVAGSSGSCGGGVAAPGVGRRLTDPARYQVQINYCPDFLSLRSTAVHELGHVIGFVHEHVRPDRNSAVSTCQQQFDSRGVAHDMILPVADHWYATVYDPRSIMNYCRDWDNNGMPEILQAGDDPWQLSTQDIQGVQTIYGWYDSGFDLPLAAFALGHQPTTSSYQANLSHSWSSAGYLPTQITRESTGTYRVDFARLAATSGNFQVSAFGSANRCKVHDWTTSGTTQRLRVKCRTPAGAAADTQFTARYQRRQEQLGWDGGYVYADQPTTSLYTPAGGYTWNSQEWGSNIVQRVGTGHYVVTLEGQGGDSSSYGIADVTAVGTGSEYCVIGGHGDDDDGSEEVTVRCHAATGAAADTRFMLAFGHFSMGSTLSYGIVTANNATAASYTPVDQRVQNYCGTPAGQATVTRSTTGRYTVNFDGLVSSSLMLAKANVHVSAWSSSGNYCNPWSLTVGNGTVGSDTAVAVRCFTPSGSAVNSTFYTTLGTTYFGDCL